MQLGGEPIRVKLKHDLTKYDPRCIVGIMGWTVPNIKIGIWGSNDTFVVVNFDNGAYLDVLWKSLDYKMPILKDEGGI
jgi:hypothetical protein